MNKKRDDAGSKFERKITKLLESWGIEVSETSNSGATHGNGDRILNSRFLAECKLQEYRGDKLIKNVTVKLNEFLKMERQAKNNMKTPIMIIGNGLGDSFAVMRLSLLAELINESGRWQENV